MAPVFTGRGTIDVGSATEPGSEGRIRLEAFEQNFTGTVTPLSAATFASPLHVFPPPNAPRVQVTRVAGVKLPATPTASFADPDVTIDSDQEVNLDIEAANIPPGTQIRLSIIPEGGESMTVLSQPLAGTLQSSTATAGPMLFPSGFTKVFVTATWSP